MGFWDWFKGSTVPAKAAWKKPARKAALKKAPASIAGKTRQLSLEWSEWENGEISGEGYDLRDDDGKLIRVRDIDEAFEAAIYGARVVEVSGESHYMEDLQDDAFAPGAKLTLVQEPNNPFDRNAIAVKDASRRRQAGYVPKKIAPEIAVLLRQNPRLQAMSLYTFFNEDGERCSLRILVGASVALPKRSG